MAMFTRVTRKEYPGAVTEIRKPFTCAAEPTIQELALVLMSDPAAMASVIIHGQIYTVETLANLDNGICNPI